MQDWRRRCNYDIKGSRARATRDWRQRLTTVLFIVSRHPDAGKQGKPARAASKPAAGRAEARRGMKR
jgi:hypothetical protein